MTLHQQTLAAAIRAVIEGTSVGGPVIACANCAAVLIVEDLEPSPDNILVTLCPFCGGQL
jgi:hypothetical protein